MDYPQGSLNSYPTFPIREQVVDPAISSPFENGMVQTRPRFTRIRRRWVINYRALTEEEKDIIKNFYINDTVGGSYFFEWENPMTEVTHSVRFTRDLEIVQITGRLYSVSFDLEEL